MSLSKPNESTAPHRWITPNWFIILLMILITGSIILGGYRFYQSRVEEYTVRQAEEIKSILNLKMDQLIHWKEDQLADARVFSKSSLYTQSIHNWMHNPTDAGLTSLLRSQYSLDIQLHDFRNIILADPNGKLLLSVDESKDTIREETRQLVIEAFNSDQVLMGSVLRDEDTGELWINICTPIYYQDRKIEAVQVLQVDPVESLFPIIQTQLIGIPSAETMLLQVMNGDVVVLNELRDQTVAPLSYRVPLKDEAVTILDQISEQSGILQGVDYRDVIVLADSEPVPGTEWFLEVKVDKIEPISDVTFFAVVIVLLAVALTMLIANFIFNFRRRVLIQELQSADRELRAANEEIRTTLYSIGDCVITTDSSGKITRMNHLAEQLTGWNEGEALGKPLNEVFQIISESTREKVENPAERVMREGKIVGLANHTLLIDRYGMEWPIADSSAPILDRNGKISGAVLVFRDQSKEREEQKEISLLNFTIANSLNEIFLIDARTLRFRFANEGALRNLGFSLEELLDKSPDEIRSDNHIDSFAVMIQPLLHHEKKLLEYETHLQRADGSVYPAKVHLQLFEYENEQVILALVDDITERNRILDELQENTTRLIQAQEVAHIGNWELRLKDRVFYASEEAAKIYGLSYTTPFFSVKEIQDAPLSEDRKRLDEALQNLLNDRIPYDIEFRIRRGNDSEIRIIHSVAKLISDENGNPDKVIGTIQDVTDLRNIEQSLIESELRYRVMFNNSRAVMLLIRPETGAIVDANQAACEYYGWTHAELCQMTIDQINTLPLKELQQEMDNAFREERVYFQFKHRLKNGNIRDVEVFSSKILVGKEPLLYSIIHDVSLRKEAEAKVKEQMDELIRWYNITLGRETRIMELKQEVNDLLVQAGQPKRYQAGSEDTAK